jgi:hypothetical protein
MNQLMGYISENWMQFRIFCGVAAISGILTICFSEFMDGKTHIFDDTKNDSEL